MKQTTPKKEVNWKHEYHIDNLWNIIAAMFMMIILRLFLWVLDEHLSLLPKLVQEKLHAYAFLLGIISFISLGINLEARKFFNTSKYK